MIKKIFVTALLLGSIAVTGCHRTGAASVRADYYGSYAYGGRYVPYYYDPFYDPFFYPDYIYGPFPHFFFRTDFLFIRPSRFVIVRDPFFPNRIIVLEDRRFVRPGARSLRGLRKGTGGSVLGGPSRDSRGGRSLR